MQETLDAPHRWVLLTPVRGGDGGVSDPWALPLHRAELYTGDETPYDVTLFSDLNPTGKMWNAEDRGYGEVTDKQHGWYIENNWDYEIVPKEEAVEEAVYIP